MALLLQTWIACLLDYFYERQAKSSLCQSYQRLVFCCLLLNALKTEPITVFQADTGVIGVKAERSSQIQDIF